MLFTSLVVGDLALNKRRLFYAVLGRDAIVTACVPALLEKLRNAGFEPRDLLLGEAPDIGFSTFTGKTLNDRFTFRDGAAETRVDGIAVCSIKQDAVRVEFRTASTPIRST